MCFCSQSCHHSSLLLPLVTEDVVLGSVRHDSSFCIVLVYDIFKNKYISFCINSSCPCKQRTQLLPFVGEDGVVERRDLKRKN